MGWDSAVLEAYLLTVLWQYTVFCTQDYGMACTSACTSTCTCTCLINREKGLVCRRAQRSDPCGPPSHRQYLWGYPNNVCRLAVLF